MRSYLASFLGKDRIAKCFRPFHHEDDCHHRLLLSYLSVTLVFMRHWLCRANHLSLHSSSPMTVLEFTPTAAGTRIVASRFGVGFL